MGKRLLRRALACLLQAGAFCMSVPHVALAADIDAHTACAIVATAFDNKDGDSLREITTFIENTMEALDTAHTEKGEVGIMVSLSDQGELNLAITAMEHCRAHIRETIYNAAAVTYRGVRDLEKAFGTAQ